MNMKRSLAGAFLMLSLTSICFGQTDQGTSPRIYIEPQDGFESYIAAAIHKKHAPVVVTQNRDAANFVLTSGVKTKEESGASKVARCLFAYCAGIAGTQTASAQLIGAQSGEVLWAYNVRKPSSDAYQSTAEAIAKHLKEFFEKSPR